MKFVRLIVQNIVKKKATG